MERGLITCGLQEVHLAAVIEILQSIRQADMSPILSRIYKAEGGSEAMDTLMKYMYVTVAVHSPVSFALGFPFLVVLGSDVITLTHGQIQGNVAGVPGRLEACFPAKHGILPNTSEAVGWR